METRKIKYFLIIFIILHMPGCNDSFLDRYPLDQLSDETYWDTEDHLRLAANACLKYLREKGRSVDMEFLADNVYRERTSEYKTIGSGNFTSDITTVNNEWAESYEGIRRCNHFLENYEHAVKVSEEIRERYAGEARFIRAYRYAYLVNFFGDVQFVTSTLDVNDEELYGTRKDKEEIIDWVIEELYEAAERLPYSADIPLSDFGRPSKEAAWGFCSRFALYQERWTVAVESAEKVMETEHHTLYTVGGIEAAYYNLFTYSGRASRNSDNKETILARVYSVDGNSSHNLSREIQVPNEETRYAPARSLVDAYLYNNLPIEHPSSGYSDGGNWTNEFTNRDPRMIQTILQRLDKWGGNPSNTTYYLHKFKNDALSCRTTTGYYFKKYVEIPAVNMYNRDENDIILLRYAEILLNWIEAKQMRGDNITQADLDNSINLLRDRVGAPRMELTFLNQYNLDLTDEIRRERRVELALEGERYFDILRWKQGHLLAADVTGIKKSIIHAEQREFAAHFETDANGYIILMQGRTFTEPKNYLWPVPFTQSERNPDLLPNNPGW